MPQTESLEEFYLNKLNWLPNNLRQDIGHFNVFKMEDCFGPTATAPQYSRRDFYKITLVRGSSIYHFADKSIEISGSTLLFFNPKVPYTYEITSKDIGGYFCIFTDAFFSERLRSNVGDLPVFQPKGQHSYVLSPAQDEEISRLFEKITSEIKTDYVYKYDLIHNYVTEIIHAALKMQPQENLYQHTDASTRITSVFNELLERQFPIDNPSQRFSLRSAKDFADQLAVHVNHLNRAIKKTTGKTTTDFITERLITEAKALLRHTSWNISEIGYALGFEEPAHFHNFFKKQTDTTPTFFRSV